MIKRAWAGLTRRDLDPESMAAAEKGRFDQETLKTGALGAPAMLQGQKWPTEWPGRSARVTHEPSSHPANLVREVRPVCSGHVRGQSPDVPPNSVSEATSFAFPLAFAATDIL